jgi:putative addiction module component (TIGR02574 family)
MSDILAELEQKAAQLSPVERGQLALRLIQSLEPTDDGDVEEVWRLEAERRLAQIEKGEARVVPGDDVFENARRRLR